MGRDLRGPKGKEMPRGWGEQYDRMNRWFARLTAPEGVDEQHMDDYYAFFTCCFHLKDWLKADETLQRTLGEAAEAHVNSHPALGVCADVANGAKHLVVSRRPRVDANARLEKGEARLTDPRGESAEERFDVVYLHADGHSQLALLIAADCVRMWNEFLVTWGLLLVKSSEGK